jgi:hypothetical protein
MPHPLARSACAGLIAGLLAAVVCAAQTPPACIAGTQQTFTPTGALQSYTVPAGAVSLYIVADGASGGLTEPPGGC